ncbi:MAG: M15 family metallopeptidase [Acidimicrobiales bacterium]
MRSSPRLGRFVAAVAVMSVVAVPAWAVDAVGASGASGASHAQPPGAGSGPTTPDIDVLRASADQVRAALAATAAQRTAAESDLAAARAAAVTAADAVAAAEAAEQAAQRRADVIDGQVREAAVAAYVGNGAAVPLGILVSSNAQDASWESTVLKYRAEQQAELLARQRRAQQALHAERAARAEAAAAASDAERRTASRVAALVDLENSQAKLVSQVDDRLDAALSEAAALAAIDVAAADKLTSDEQNLRNAVAQSVPEADPAVTGGLPATRSTVPPPTTTPSPTTTRKPSPGVTAPPPTTTPSPSPGTTIPVPIPVDTVNVGGFIVARSIAAPFGSLLQAAAAAGIALGGSAYRDVNTQVELRRQHCGTTDYDIWQRPASQCSPPTAIPGRSMHEKGLAIDFTCDRVLIGDHANRCFVWLAANASSFGFYNLPSEPWHWSTNGN